MCARYCAASLLLTLAYANAGEIHTSRSLTILFRFEQPYAQPVLRETQRELKTLIGEEGVKLEWRDRDNFGGQSTSKIVVLSFLGNCDPGTGSSFNGPMDGWLARMHVSDSVVLPFGDVNCDLVRALMSSGPNAIKLGDKSLGRALARVLAHELHHFLTQSTEHATQGLEKPSFSRTDLVSDSLRLERQELPPLSKAIFGQ